jgi:hypothetical protein
VWACGHMRVCGRAPARETRERLACRAAGSGVAGTFLCAVLGAGVSFALA